MVNKIETEVFARLLSKSQNVTAIGILMTPSKQQNISDQIGEAEKVLVNLITAFSHSEKINNNCAAAITKLSDCTAVLEQLKQETTRRKEAVCIIQNYSCVLSYSKAEKKTIGVESDDSDESDEDLNKKPQCSKPKSQKPNKFPKSASPAYMKNESQNFIKHRCYNLELGMALMKLSNHSWKFDTSLPACLMSNKPSLWKVPNAAICIHSFYRSMVADGEPEGQTVEKITKIVKMHADVLQSDSGLDFFMLQFPKMKILSIDFCGLITSQPGEGAFKHDPKINAIAVFLLKDEAKRFHFVLVNGLQSLILFIYNWEDWYLGKNVLEPALKRKYDEAIGVLAPYIINERNLEKDED
eukprot:jgi/Psemu1/49690/gm1.49690_g